MSQSNGRPWLPRMLPLPTHNPKEGGGFVLACMLKSCSIGCAEGLSWLRRASLSSSHHYGEANKCMKRYHDEYIYIYICLKLDPLATSRINKPQVFRAGGHDLCLYFACTGGNAYKDCLPLLQFCCTTSQQEPLLQCRAFTYLDQFRAGRLCRK